ncbi:hypothetical protein D9758_010272 [Tetrapyrgos nigripes]|uniref:SWIM-type domain-containing protein n=1 Tax=Tetrapyrgos nigripes TaxID=182062 RepID=A0A8H5GAB1_9AGAR|nr:hypothetical protein D9758_010272 [Tetrapyrgos nigripes]
MIWVQAEKTGEKGDGFDDEDIEMESAKEDEAEIEAEEEKEQAGMDEDDLAVEEPQRPAKCARLIEKPNSQPMDGFDYDIPSPRAASPIRNMQPHLQEDLPGHEDEDNEPLKQDIIDLQQVEDLRRRLGSMHHPSPSPSRSPSPEIILESGDEEEPSQDPTHPPIVSPLDCPPSHINSVRITQEYIDLISNVSLSEDKLDKAVIKCLQTSPLEEEADISDPDICLSIDLYFSTANASEETYKSVCEAIRRRCLEIILDSQDAIHPPKFFHVTCLLKIHASQIETSPAHCPPPTSIPPQRAISKGSVASAPQQCLCKGCARTLPLTTEFWRLKAGKYLKSCLACLEKSERNRPAKKKVKVTHQQSAHNSIYHMLADTITVPAASEATAASLGPNAQEQPIEGSAVTAANSEYPVTPELQEDPEMESMDARVNISGLTARDSSDLHPIADQVAAQVWDATELRFLYHSKYEHKNTASARYKYHCAQQNKCQHKPLKSISGTAQCDKGQMYSFDCDGWLYVTLYEGEPCANVQLKHCMDHSPYVGHDVPEDIQKYVKDNCKLSTTVLWADILKKYPNPQFKRQAKRGQWYRDKDQLKSAKIILDECKTAGSATKYTVTKIKLPAFANGYTALAFSLPDIMMKFGVRNTNASRFELYALLGEVFGSGCPLGYLLLQSPKLGEEGVIEQYIHAFLEHFPKVYQLNPSFMLTDKNLPEINACSKAFPTAKHQLCFWHCLRAVKQQLSILRHHPKYYKVDEARNEFGDAINKDFVPVGQVNESDQVHFPVAADTIPRVVVRLNGVLQNTAPPKPRFVIRINRQTCSVYSNSPDTVAEVSGPINSSEEDGEEEYTMNDSEFHKFFGDNDTDDEFGPDWMFDDSEKPSKDPQLETGQWTTEQIRRNAVMEMYQFCYQRGLREVWGYIWTSWYSQKMWCLWARSSLSTLLSRLRTTMNVENFWRQLKHENLHHILHPRLDQLVWILIYEVTPSYITHTTELDPVTRLARSQGLTPFQKSFKSDWIKLSKQSITSSEKYITSIDTWICNCGQQKYNSHALCKHLVQAVKRPSGRFFTQIIRRRIIPIYEHPELVPIGNPPGIFKDVTDGSSTDGDDQDWIGDTSQLANSMWRQLKNQDASTKHRQSSAFTQSSISRSSSPTEDPDHSFAVDTQSGYSSDNFTRASSPVAYGNDGEEELQKYEEFAEARAQELRLAAELIEQQIPYENFSWLKSLHDCKLGHDVHHFVKDIASFEDSRGL